MKTREEKVERHFRNSVREKLLDLMSVMDPGEQLRWGSYNQKQLLNAAKERIEAELNHENGEDNESKSIYVEDETPAEDPTKEKSQAALALPRPTISG